MIDYPTYCQLRHLRDQAHLTIAQIARQLGLHWQTVAKWEKCPRYERLSAAPATRRASKLDAFKPLVQRLLTTHPYSAGGAAVYPRLDAPALAAAWAFRRTRDARPAACTAA